MRLVQVAKALGMTGQELRHELTQVNFGVKPTDREIPDALAKGVMRFVANKKGITIDVDAIVAGGGMVDGTDDSEQAQEAASVETESAESGTDDVPAQAVGHDRTVRPAEGLNVLRKLSLDDVPREAIQRQQVQEAARKPSAQELEEARREERVLAQRKAATGANQQQIKRKDGKITLPESITVKELAEKTGFQVPVIMQTLMKNGVMATITQSVDYDTAAVVATELGLEVEREERTVKTEDVLNKNLKELLKDEPEKLKPRPPVVVVMGHVDHGKTALLDAIRHTNVVGQESGGITQHIGAYQVEHGSGAEKRKITFLDTPGHEAFTAMRARGAQVTDIVILVVSAEEGVKPTTIEAIDHAKEADVAVIVAITKIDKERSDPDRVKGELAQHGLQPEEWGGTTPFVLCSAVTKQGIPDLLDHILLLADIRDMKANPDRAAIATVIESHLDTAHGPLVTVVVNAGTLRMGDTIVCGQSMGRVKALMDDQGHRLMEVPPSGPVRVAGLGGVPQVGDILQAVATDKEAKKILDELSDAAAGQHRRSFADLVSRLSEGKMTQLKVVLKTDAQGSLEAIQEALRKKTVKLENQEIHVKVIHGAIGAVSENDVMMAAASDGIVMSFHVPVPPDVRRTAEREGVKVREYEILYQLLDEAEGLLKGMVEPEEQENILGHLEIRGVFLTKKGEQIIGGKVTDGIIKRVPFRLMRDGVQVGSGRITSLKHVDKDIKEAKEGSECGMRVDTTLPIQEGDVIEAYLRELKRREAVT